MDLLSMLALVTVFPWASLAFLLWMARLEDGLPAAVRRAERSPDPPPVLAIPVQRATRADPPVPAPDVAGVPEQPAAPALETGPLTAPTG